MRMKWFRQWGWLYVPSSVPGAVICVTTIAFCVSVFLAIDRQSHSASDTLYHIFPFFTCAFLLWDWIGARTSN
jgi:hypothetical protein